MRVVVLRRIPVDRPAIGRIAWGTLRSGGIMCQHVRATCLMCGPTVKRVAFSKCDVSCTTLDKITCPTVVKENSPSLFLINNIRGCLCNEQLFSLGTLAAAAPMRLRPPAHPMAMLGWEGRGFTLFAHARTLQSTNINIHKQPTPKFL